MNRLAFTILIFASFIMYSCKDEEKSTENEEATAQTTSSEEMKQSMSKSSDVKYNPAHGEEGHRCDLPVGAPLESANASTTEKMTTSPVRHTSATPKINPPHGEPGHDCSVPVGAKLEG